MWYFTLSCSHPSLHLRGSSENQPPRNHDICENQQLCSHWRRLTCFQLLKSSSSRELLLLGVLVVSLVTPICEAHLYTIRFRTCSMRTDFYLKLLSKNINGHHLNTAATCNTDDAVLRSVTQPCPTLRDPMVCSPPGPSVHGDSPGKTTGVGCHALLQEHSQPRDQRERVFVFVFLMRRV